MVDIGSGAKRNIELGGTMPESLKMVPIKRELDENAVCREFRRKRKCPMKYEKML